MPPVEAREFVVDIIEDLTLTPFAGASLMNEILKGLLFEKRQIPYPFGRLKQVVEKRRKTLENASNTTTKSNFTLDNHYRTVSKVYDSLDSIIKGVNREFCDRSSGTIEEVLIVLGDSPFSVREVFSIAVPSLSRRHFERNHCEELNKHMPRVLRRIFLSQEWVDCMDATVPCTNVYVYLKKRPSEASLDGTKEEGEAFRPCEPPEISNRSKCTRIRFNYVSDKPSDCCQDLVIFDDDDNDNDDSREEAKEDSRMIESQLEDDKVCWYRSSDVLKGYKDSFFKGVSVSDLW